MKNGTQVTVLLRSSKREAISIANSPRSDVASTTVLSSTWRALSEVNNCLQRSPVVLREEK